MVYGIYGFLWCKSNHLDWKKQFPHLVTNGYPLSGGNSNKEKRLMLLYLKRTDYRVSYLVKRASAYE
jgi:hypothetical protein